MAEFLYDAFISYSHRDMNWARWLQRRLETFRIPRDLRAEASSLSTRLRVFRDQTDLAGVELHDSLRQSLDAARYLIVVCSPSSAASHWVDEEIRYFISLGRIDCIVPFIVDGEPESSDPALECYPPALRSMDDRQILGASVQEIGRDKAALKTISVLLGVRFNRIVDREKRRRRQTALIGSLSVALILGSITGLLIRNAAVSRKNQELSFDIYGAAVVSLSQKDQIEEADIEFLRVSAEAGNTQAIVFLADCLLNGWGTPSDPESAVAWYRRAAEAGDSTAMLALANCYLHGTGVEADPEQSYSWDLKAAEAGEPGAMVNVGICYEDGIGVTADPAEALRWYRMAAEADYDLGLYNLARCYLDGVGTQPDPAEAFVWIAKLAEQGNTAAMYNTALMYQHGYGVEADMRQAYLWYRRAAEAGDAEAMYMVGWCTENRVGTEDAALEWYRSALENGCDQAAEDVARLEAQLAGAS